MKRLIIATVICAIPVVCLGSAVWADANSQMAEASLQPLNASGTTGFATLHLVGTKLTVDVHLDGLAPGAHAEHVHLGTCAKHAAPPPIVFDLPDLVPNPAGQAHVHAVFEDVAVIPPTGWYVNIHSTSVDTSSGVACGDVSS